MYDKKRKIRRKAEKNNERIKNKINYEVGVQKIHQALVVKLFRKILLTYTYTHTHVIYVK